MRGCRMLKLAVAVLAVALAGAASAAAWEDLRIDGTSEDAFKQSLAAFQKELSPERQQVFSGALVDIWLQGTAKAQADQREFTAADFQRQLDGLGYEEVVNFTDPSGDTAKERYREAKRMVASNSGPPVSPWQNPFNSGNRLERAARAPGAEQRAAHEERDVAMMNQGTQASPGVVSGIEGISSRGTNSCGGNFGGCENQPTVPR